jgi:hypothetical protein
MSDRDPLQELWASQHEEGFSMSLAEIRLRATSFSTTIRRRNVTEYTASALVVGAFAVFSVILPDPLSRIGALLSALGSLYVCWRLHVLARAEKLDGLSGVAPWVEAHRAQMVRQRDALRKIWSWYLGPLAPGVVLLWTGIVFSNHSDAPLGLRVTTLVAVLGVVALVFWGIAHANSRAAQTLQAQIDALDRARR